MTAQSTNILKHNQAGKSLLPLEQDVAAGSATQQEIIYSAEQALEVALLIIEALSSVMLSADKMFLAFNKVLHHKPDWIDEDSYYNLLNRILNETDQVRKRNPMSRMF